MIKVFCDICGKEPEEFDFAFDARLEEDLTSLEGKDMTPRVIRSKKMIHICKACYYTHLNKLINGKKK